MAMDSTPWLVGGGAEHTAETARLLAYVATGGHEGVAEPGDLKVTPLAVPGGGVRVAPGGVLVRNSNPGGGQQTYVARNPQTDTVSVQATGSSGGRADMIAVVVRDPQYPGTPVPSDPVTARYVDIEVIQGVPANARTAADAGLTYPAYPLARINLPASTGTVQAAHITDLRSLSNPKRLTVPLVKNIGSADTHVAGRTGNYNTLAEFSVDVPEWATTAVVDGTLAGCFVRHPNGGVTGNFDFDGLGSFVGAAGGFQQTGWGASGSVSYERIDFHAGGEVEVEEARRGTVQRVRLRVRIPTTAPVGSEAGTEGQSLAKLTITFQQGIE